MIVETGAFAATLALCASLAQGWLGLAGAKRESRADAGAAAALGKRLRLVARAERSPSGHLRASVGVEAVEADDPLASARGEQNACVIGCSSGARHVVRGAGAGRWQTTESVFADLLDIARGAQHPANGPCQGNTHQSQLREAEVTL